MNRRRILIVLVHGVAGLTAGLLGSGLAAAAESAEKVVRLGFVDPHSPTTNLRGVDVFWQRSWSAGLDGRSEHGRRKALG